LSGAILQRLKRSLYSLAKAAVNFGTVIYLDQRPLFIPIFSYEFSALR